MSDQDREFLQFAERHGLQAGGCRSRGGTNRGRGQRHAARAATIGPSHRCARRIEGSGADFPLIGLGLEVWPEKALDDLSWRELNRPRFRARRCRTQTTLAFPTRGR